MPRFEQSIPEEEQGSKGSEKGAEEEISSEDEAAIRKIFEHDLVNESGSPKEQEKDRKRFAEESLSEIKRRLVIERGYGGGRTSLTRDENAQKDKRTF